jgi:hypothetical protein
MFDPTSFVGFHTWLSIIAILAGIPVAIGLLKGHTVPRWTGIYLATAFATSATGYGFPFTGLAYTRNHAVILGDRRSSRDPS